ncbi:MAG TPA: hypothetical protein VIJ37_05795 [Steroidobacteraceae bacterium]
MNTQISTKLAALAVAVMMNGLILGGVAYVFNAQQHAPALSLLQAGTSATTLATQVEAGTVQG